jgi:hypothetical protein
MPMCSLCGEEMDHVTKCKTCGEKFCDDCGDTDEKLCIYCLDEDSDEDDDDSEDGYDSWR